MKIAVALLAGMLGVASLSFGAEAEHATHDSKPHASTGATYPTPPAEQTRWPVPMLMIIAGMFIAAAVIGPIVRSEASDEPDAHGHDSHGHGHDAHGHSAHHHDHH